MLAGSVVDPSFSADAQYFCICVSDIVVLARVVLILHQFCVDSVLLILVIRADDTLVLLLINLVVVDGVRIEIPVNSIAVPVWRSH